MLVNSEPSITQTYPDSFCAGNPATLSAVASTGNVNWYSFPVGGSSLATSGTYIITGLTGSATYYVDATYNGCTSASRTAVTATYYPAAPGQTGAISGSSSPSLHATETYSVSAASNAGSYFWTAPLGTILSGQGTNSITVSWDTFGFASVTVVANNACGTGPAQNLFPIIISNGGGGSQTFSYTGGQQTFTVPNGVTQVALAVYGAQGGGQYNNGAPGGLATGNLNVTPGQNLNLFVGGQNGYNGGGSGGGNGGGMSDVRVGGTAFSNWVIVAGGGGGGGNNGSGYVDTAAGAGGGGIKCANGQGGSGGGFYTGYPYSRQGGPGTCDTGGASGYSYGGWAGGGGGGGLNSGGAGGVSGGYGNPGTDGSQGQGGNAVSGTCSCPISYAGGGGGGYYGGGGASTGCCAGGGGGGGSSWVSNAVIGPTFWGGQQMGNGQIVVMW